MFVRMHMQPNDTVEFSIVVYRPSGALRATDIVVTVRPKFFPALRVRETLTRNPIDTVLQQRAPVVRERGIVKAIKVSVGVAPVDRSLLL